MTQKRFMWAAMTTLVCVALVACGCAKTSAPAPPKDAAAPPDSYAAHQSLVRRLSREFRPNGFQIINHSDGDAVYFNFDPAWGKRNRTTINNDDSKPSQTELVFLEPSSNIVTVLEVMYTATELAPDIIGFIAIPPQNVEDPAANRVAIEPPLTRTQLFAYGNSIVALHTFPKSTDIRVTQADLAMSNRRFTIELKNSLESTKS